MFTMPKAKLGDMVYWSADTRNFTNPVLGWIAKEPGAQTATILVFAPNMGFMEKPSVHHRDDPGLLENPGWLEWGCWAHSPFTETINKLESMSSQLARAMSKLEAVDRGKQQASK